MRSKLKICKKRSGEIATIFSLFAALFLCAVIAYELQIQQYDAIKTSTEDALAASNLASAVIDIQEFGSTHNIIVGDPARAFQIYKDALKVNMGLDESMQSENAAITGNVQILQYIVYNVSGTDIDVYCYGENPYTTSYPNGLGTVTAPNGKIIESTSVYSKITFPVKGYFGITTTAVKDKLVDIMIN